MLSQTQEVQFERDGYTTVPDAFDHADLESLLSEHAALVDRRLRRLVDAGQLQAACLDDSFERRFVHLCEAEPVIARDIDIDRTLARSAFDFMTSDKVLDLAEAVVGPEITLSPVQHIRGKLPRWLSEGGSAAHEVPWHQDAAVVWPEADDGFCLTMWIALSDATFENGCVQVIPGAHGQGLVAHEQTRAGTMIVDPSVVAQEPVPIIVPKGGALLMTNWTPHRSGENTTEAIRWSIDLRYLPTGTPTGRPFHPSFVVRSRRNPKLVDIQYEGWAAAWRNALKSSKDLKFHRYHVKFEEHQRHFYAANRKSIGTFHNVTQRLKTLFG